MQLGQGGHVFTLFVCLFVSRVTQKLLNRFSFLKKGKNMAHGISRKKPMDFGGNPDYVTLC